MPQTIYFFSSGSSVARLAFDVASGLYPLHTWHQYIISTMEEQERFMAATHAPDLLISFLNPFILPASLLEGVGGRAFNVHPASPDYPGRDPQHFAFYEGSLTAGATLHQMEASVDSGMIVDVIEQPIDREQGVMHFIEKSNHLSIVLLLRNMAALLENTAVPAPEYAWRSSAKRSRRDFLNMCQIAPSMSEEEVSRRIEAFFNPAYRNLHIDLYGYRFVYDPAEEANG